MIDETDHGFATDREARVHREIRAALASHSLDNDQNEDSLAVVLCTYFEHHLDCPEDEEEGEHGWKPWAVERCERMLDQLAKAALALNPMRVIAEV